MSTCKYCNKIFTRLHNLYKHQRTAKYCLKLQCSEKADADDLSTCKYCSMEFNRQDNLKRHEKVCTVKEKSDTQNQQLLEMIVTIDFIQEGAKGYAAFANSYPFKNRVLCTDKARKKLRYKDGDGEVIDDGGLKLAQRFFRVIAPRNEEIINEEYRILQEKVQNIADDERAHTADLTTLLTKATHLQDLLIKCRNAARGEENELTKEFISHLSKML